MKSVVRALFKEDGSFNFVEHRSIEIRFGTLEGRYGIFLWPGFLFTHNGVTKIEGRIASKISARYLNPLFNRNSNKKGELKFWEFFLRNGKFVREQDSWFKGFNLKELRSEIVGWTSETLSLNLQRITNYF